VLYKRVTVLHKAIYTWHVLCTSRGSSTKTVIKSHSLSVYYVVSNLLIDAVLSAGSSQRSWFILLLSLLIHGPFILTLASLLRFFDHTYRHTVGLLWASDQPVAETCTYTGHLLLYIYKRMCVCVCVRLSVCSRLTL
jgi:hypothetical protein